MFKKCDKHKGFTLAEVLITLGIIGVVVALTLPALIANYKLKSNIVALKKNYSALSQAVEHAKLEHGEIGNWDWDLSVLNQDGFVNKYFVPYLKVAEICSSTDSTCLSGFKYATLDGTTYVTSNDTKIKLADGTILILGRQDNYHCHVLVDVNGLKKPNKYGVDVYNLILVRDTLAEDYNIMDRPGLFFWGHGKSLEWLEDNCSASGAIFPGESCGELYQMNGWQPCKTCKF